MAWALRANDCGIRPPRVPSSRRRMSEVVTPGPGGRGGDGPAAAV